MQKWQDVLNSNGLTVDNLNKNIQALIKDYNDAQDYLLSAKEKLAESKDEDEINEIKGDIKEIETELPQLNQQIVAGIEKNAATLAKRRENMKKVQAARKGNKSPETPTNPPEYANVSATTAKSAAPAAPEVVVEDESKEKEKKKGGLGATEIVVGGLLGIVGIGLGLNYIFPDVFSRLLKRK